MSRRWWLSYALAWAVTLKPAIALSAAFSEPGCLAGRSPAGLPWIVPTLACLVLLGVGWWMWPARESLWQLFGWACLVGASDFARSPLSRALDWYWPRWEPVVLFVLSVALIVRGSYALASRIGLYRLLAWLLAAVVLCAVLVPWVPPIVDHWTALVLWAGYGSLIAVVGVGGYLYHRQERDRWPRAYRPHVKPRS